jgi:hypothetical protein
VQGWDWKQLSRDRRISLEMGLALDYYPWNTEQLHTHPLLSIEWFTNITHIQWDLSELSKHPNMSLEWIAYFAGHPASTKKMWDPYMLACNRYNYIATFEYWCKRKRQTLQHTCRIRDELIQRAWEPSRFMNWCLDQDEASRLRQHWELVSSR